jgi:hypothetical protein
MLFRPSSSLDFRDLVDMITSPQNIVLILMFLPRFEIRSYFADFLHVFRVWIYCSLSVISSPALSFTGLSLQVKGNDGMTKNGGIEVNRFYTKMDTTPDI